MRAANLVKAVTLITAVSVMFFDCASKVKITAVTAKNMAVTETETGTQPDAYEAKAVTDEESDRTRETKKDVISGGKGGGTLKTAKETFTDSRDGKTYKTVKMPDGKTWMAQNLNYETDSSWCYRNPYNCNIYGRLYNWDNAMWACPSGWHLPSYREWTDLFKSVGGKRQVDEGGDTIWGGASYKLKAKNGWQDDYCDIDGNAGCRPTDDFGFSALPGGEKYSFSTSFMSAESDGYWWAATETYDEDAYYFRMSYSLDYVLEHNAGFRPGHHSSGLSVRCVQD
jgi:uncharacterized protein (TIGR02145 family)